jgi:hypothetical protein
MQFAKVVKNGSDWDLHLGVIPPAAADLRWTLVAASGQSSLTLRSEEEQATAQVGSYFLIPIPIKPNAGVTSVKAAASGSWYLIFDLAG